MATLVYVLCALTSLTAATLLARAWVRSRSRLLLWSSAAFVLLAANNVILFLDKVIIGPEVDLSLIRGATGLAGLALLLFGLLEESR